MKMIVAICLCAISLFALDSPQPIQGAPSLMAGKSFSTVAGNSSFVFKFPKNWGLSDISASETGGNFSLFPSQGGYGCQIKVAQFADEASAKMEADRIRNTFAGTSSIPDGFEASIGNARYACYVNERYVNEIWYVLPKKKTIDQDLWQQLKQCVSVSEIKLQSAGKTWVPVHEIPWKGWSCNHPNNKLHVLLTTHSFDQVQLNNDLTSPHLLHLKDRNGSGYFYIRWDQKDLETINPYKAHLAEMKEHIMSLETAQRFEKEPVFNQEDGWALLNGTPYTLLSLSGDGFLFGFSLKSKGMWHSLDLDSYVKRVKWWEDQ